jgi:maltoporin
MSAQFEEHTESRHQAVAQRKRVIAERVESVLSNFIEIGGYFRAGYGRNGQGGPMSGFKAPGAASKYRLGNEAENYGELILAKNMYLPGVFSPHAPAAHRLDGPIARVQVRTNFFNPYDAHSSAASTQVGLPEAWAAIGNVFKSQPNLKFWAGNRFYRRHDIHIIDFYHWDMSGGGGGVEDITVGPVKFALAWIGLGSTSGLSYLPQPQPENRAGFSKSNVDFRIYDIPLLAGKLEAGLTYAHSESGTDRNGNQAPDSHGFALNLVHTVPHFLSRDGSHKFSFQYGIGSAKTFTSGFETFQQDGATYIRPDDAGSYRFRVTESFVASPSRYFSVGPVVLAQATQYSSDTRPQYWVSAGVRPIVHLHDHFNIALEGGLDWVNDQEEDLKGTLLKLTVAPQISVDRLFMSRPVIRAFFTYAHWSDELVGQVGGQDHLSLQDGFNWGAQMEAWW